MVDYNGQNKYLSILVPSTEKKITKAEIEGVLSKPK